jgi:tetratricopeptide (TPR) repeat protein
MSAATARALHEIGLLHGLEGRRLAALECWRCALVLFEKAGPEHLPDVANVLGYLGKYQERARDYGRAREHFERALAIMSRRRPSDADLARLKVQTLVNLADLETIEHRYARAEALYLRAAATVDRILGADEREKAAILNGLGIVCRRTGRLREAEAFYRRALRVLERRLGPHHPSSVPVARNLAAVQRARRGARSITRADVRARAAAPR